MCFLKYLCILFVMAPCTRHANLIHTNLTKHRPALGYLEIYRLVKKRIQKHCWPRNVRMKMELTLQPFPTTPVSNHTQNKHNRGLTVAISLSTQSGATLWRCVRWNCRWILLLSMSWHNGQRNMGWTECCVITCILRRFRSVLVNLQ